MISPQIQITECPRDAMQGIQTFIPTATKIEYLNLLLKVGFDTLDFGSFVSPKAIPQMQDTVQVVQNLDLSESKTKLLAIVANERGATDACTFEAIHYLGFPLSISETFQQRNTNASIAEAIQKIEWIQNLCTQHQKNLVIYLSMGFGNPYGDPWSIEILEKWAHQVNTLGVKKILLADTVGTASAALVADVFKHITTQLPKLHWGVHLHATPEQNKAKIEAAYLSGCLQFDTAMLGFGGCPMAKDDLTGNIATEQLTQYFDSINVDLKLNKEAFEKALFFSHKVFNPSVF